MRYLRAALWLIGALALVAAILSGLNSDGPYFIVAQSYAYKLFAGVTAAIVLRFTLKGFDAAIGLDIKTIMIRQGESDNALPIFMYAGARFIGLSILFGYIFSS